MVRPFRNDDLHVNAAMSCDSQCSCKLSSWNEIRRRYINILLCVVNSIDDALINTDQALGILLDWVEENEMKIPIIVTSDHGWNEGTWEHSLNTINTRTIPILSNDSSIVTPFSAKQQCSIAPTIYKYFSVKKSSYTDVSDAACFAMY